MSRLVVLACLALSCWAAMAGAEGTGPYMDGMTFVSMLLCTRIPRYPGVPHHLSRHMHTCIHPALFPSSRALAAAMRTKPLPVPGGLAAPKGNLVLHIHPAHSALTSALCPPPSAGEHSDQQERSALHRRGTQL